MGVKTVNELPLNARMSDNTSYFMKIIDTFYSKDLNLLYYNANVF